MFYVVGLGNPGDEYKESRHNAGRMALLRFHRDLDLEKFEFNKKTNSLLSEAKIKKEKITLILPETFMNKSGNSISYFLKPPALAKATTNKEKRKRGLENLIVIHDDIDLPIGTLKISYNKGTGGHRGLDSIVKALKTREFVRVRIGISPSTSKGKVKKPGANLPAKKAGEEVIDFILGKFKPKELETLKKVLKKASEAVQSLITIGRDRTMNIYN